MKQTDKRRILALLLALTLLPALAQAARADGGDVYTVALRSEQDADGSYRHEATVNGAAAESFDYAWHADPSAAHDEVKDAPAEYYTGTKPDTEAAVYIAHDLFYYPELPESGFRRVNYDGEQEWAYYYTAEEYADYIFATLPIMGDSVPAQMMHSAEEAWENAVLHITKPGTYVLSGQWHGQIWIDLGDADDTFADETAKVTLVLSGVDVTCTAAPAVVFRSVYECDNAWETREQATHTVDLSDAGARVVIADGTVNSVAGGNIYRMLRTAYKSGTSESDPVRTQKKQRKIDGAFYSYISMAIDGEPAGSGTLNITADYEGLDSELHLALNGGRINIHAQDDGINVNEDGVSVVAVNGGDVHILAGLGREGDGIDSNGYLVVNGGTLVSAANPASDSGMDSDSGTYVNGGTVVALGSTMDWAESDEAGAAGDQAAMNLAFSTSQSADEAIVVTDTDGRVVLAYDPDRDETAGGSGRSYSGAIVSAPGIVVGGTYYVYIGGDVDGTEDAGFYDVTSVAGFSDETKQQCYSGTAELGGRGMRGGGVSLPNGFDPSQLDRQFGEDGGRGEPPDGFGGDDRGEPPDGFGGGDRGEPPDGFGGDDDRGEPPDGFGGNDDRGEPPDGFGGMRNGGEANGDGTLEFTLSAKVNGFTGVTDYTGAASSGSASLFTDVAADDWFADDVAYAAEQGLMNGVGNGRFDPSGGTTRGMIMTILARLDGADTAGGALWYEKGMEWAVANGISDGTRPEDPITREQLATMLYRYARKQGQGFSGAWAFPLDYTDAGEISDWAYEAACWCAMNEILRGSDGALRPSDGATRAETAAMLRRLVSALS